MRLPFWYGCSGEPNRYLSCMIYNVLLFDRHVQVSNDDALEFYQKFGFRIVDTKEQYYKRIDPPHAFVLQKNLKDYMLQ